MLACQDGYLGFLEVAKSQQVTRLMYVLRYYDYIVVICQS